MNAREVLEGMARTDRGNMTVWSPAQVCDALNAYRAEVLREAADRLALELAPEQPGAGPGFLLALRIAMRTLRRIADEAAVR